MIGDRERVIAVFGQSGSGKTLLCRYLARRRPAILVWDPHGYFGDLGMACPSLDQLIKALSAQRPPPRIVFQPRDESDAAGFLGCMSACTGYTFVLDECEMLARFGVSGGQTHPALRDAAEYGRHPYRWQGLIFGSRRPALVPRVITAQADLICAFHTHEPTDQTYLRQSGLNSSLCRRLEPPPDGHDFTTYPDGGVYCLSPDEKNLDKVRDPRYVAPTVASSMPSQEPQDGLGAREVDNGQRHEDRRPAGGDGGDSPDRA